jgi:hypothetical protein
MGKKKFNIVLYEVLLEGGLAQAVMWIVCISMLIYVLVKTLIECG